MTRAEGLTARWSRRCLTVPLLIVTAAAVSLTAPAWLLLSLITDLVRRRRLATTRLALMLGAILAFEVYGLAASLALWLRAPRGGEPSLARHARLQTTWAAGIFAAARWIYGLRLEVDGADQVPRGPLLVLMRHTSLADTTLPAVVLQAPHGLRLRYVLKQELLRDPCLDVVGQRLPNAFVARESGDPDQLARVRDLADGLGPGDGVLIYPEGTRFSPAKLRRALEKLAQADPERATRLRGLQHVLPPRPGGARTLLGAAPDADVLLVAHTGLEPARALSSLWNGELIGQTVRVRLRRVPAGEVPREPGPAGLWLDEQWLELDAWVAAQGSRARQVTPAG